MTALQSAPVGGPRGRFNADRVGGRDSRTSAADPLMRAGESLARLGGREGRSLPVVVALLAPDALTPAILQRAIPGLHRRWSAFRPILDVALEEAGLTLIEEPVAHVTTLLTEAQEPAGAQRDLSATTLFGRELRRFALLSAAEERVLGRWVAEWQCLERLAAGDAVDADTLLARAWTSLRQAIEAGTIVAPPRSSLCGWLAALLAHGYRPLPRDPNGEFPTDALHATVDSAAICRTMPPRLLARAAVALVAHEPLPDSIPEDISWRAQALRDRGRAARDVLVRHNLRLVAHVAQESGTPLAWDDRMQEGAIGLLRAAERFDFRAGARFSTYATWWIRQTIARGAADRGDLVRLPTHVRERAAAVPRRTAPDDIDVRIQALIDAGLAPSAAHNVARVASPLSLDHGAGMAAQLLPDPDATDTLDAIGAHEALASAIARLTPRQQRIVNLRFGLDGNGAQTLEQIGREFGVTRERIRQIEAKALRRLGANKLLRETYAIAPDQAAATTPHTKKRRSQQPDAAVPPPAEPPDDDVEQLIIKASRMGRPEPPLAPDQRAKLARAIRRLPAAQPNLNAIANLRGLTAGEHRWLARRTLGLSSAPLTLVEMIAAVAIDPALARAIDERVRDTAAGLITEWRGLFVPRGLPWHVLAATVSP